MLQKALLLFSEEKSVLVLIGSILKDQRILKLLESKGT